MTKARYIIPGEEYHGLKDAITNLQRQIERLRAQRDLASSIAEDERKLRLEILNDLKMQESK